MAQPRAFVSLGANGLLVGSATGWARLTTLRWAYMSTNWQARLGAVLGFASVFAVVGACSSSSPAPSGLSCPSAGLSFTEADSGRTVTVKVGQRFQVCLAGNGTTGYQWTAVIADPSVLSQAGETFQPSNTSPGVVGAGGLDTFTFEALHAGSTTLTLNYARSFEKGVPPIQVVRLVVVVD